MTIWKLPTRANRVYKGKYPNYIRSISLSARDIEDKKCMHIESNDGQRYTISYDRLDIRGCKEISRFVGLPWHAFVIGDHTPTDMTQAQYDAWLADIRTKREQKA